MNSRIGRRLLDSSRTFIFDEDNENEFLQNDKRVVGNDNTLVTNQRVTTKEINKSKNVPNKS